MLGTILIVLLLLFMIGAFSRYGYNQSWDIQPLGAVGILLLLIVVLLLLGRI